MLILILINLFYAALNRALRLLERSDTTVDVFVEKTGQCVIAAAGELHLERCLRDLKEVWNSVVVGERTMMMYE